MLSRSNHTNLAYGRGASSGVVRLVGPRDNLRLVVEDRRTGAAMAEAGPLSRTAPYRRVRDALLHVHASTGGNVLDLREARYALRRAGLSA